MKRKLNVILMLCLMLALIACGDKTVDQIEQKVSEIGVVTLDSKEQIEEISALYNGLPENQKSKVENIAIFEEAQQAYEILKAEEDQRIAEEEEQQRKAEEEKKANELVAEGYNYLIGSGGKEKDLHKAVECFEGADALGNLDGSFLAGWVYDWEFEEGEGKDFEKARAFYEKCKADNPLANFCLGVNYYYGQGIEADEATAKMLFGNARNMIKSGRYELDVFPYVYAYGIGTFYMSDVADYPNERKAVEWFEKAYEAGRTRLLDTIPALYTSLLSSDVDFWTLKPNENFDKDFNKALEWYEKAAEITGTDRTSKIADLYFEKYKQTNDKADYDKAKELYMEKADLGDSEAFRGIGYMCWYTDADFKTTVEWYTKAADLGNAEAMADLWTLYFYRANETGAQEDSDKSHYWYEKAVENGYTP